MLFEEEGHSTTGDWFDVCPNADELVLTDEVNMSPFDICILHGREWDRVRVAEAMHTASVNRPFLITVLNNTFPNNDAILFAARELVLKVPDSLLCSVLAFSHDGTGNPYIKFPNKKEKAIPRSLLKAFGLRGSEEGWFHRLADNESFVRMVAGNIKEKDWLFLIHDKATLLKTNEEQNTAPQLQVPQEGRLW